MVMGLPLSGHGLAKKLAALHTSGGGGGGDEREKKNCMADEQFYQATNK